MNSRERFAIQVVGYFGALATYVMCVTGWIVGTSILAVVGYPTGEFWRWFLPVLAAPFFFWMGSIAGWWSSKGWSEVRSWGRL